LGGSFRALNIEFFPIPKNDEVVSHPVRAWSAGKTSHKTDKTKIWLIAHIPKPAVASPLEHGCKYGTFGLEPILFEGQMSSDFLQDLVCNGRSVCSKGCVCFEQNLSCTELCPCQALDLCHNMITHRTDIEDDDA
jgi:hypothetical protein